MRRFIKAGLGAMGVIVLAAVAGWILLYGSIHWFAGADRPVPFSTLPQMSNRVGPSPPRFRGARVGDTPRIVDGSGRTVIFRGATLDYSSTVHPPFADLVNRGFNAVRIRIPWSALEPAAGSLSTGTRARVAALMDKAGHHRMGVILASPFSRDSTCPRASGVPSWASRLRKPGTHRSPCGEGILDQLGNMPVAARFLLDFLHGEWTPDGASLQDHLITSWTWLAASLRNHPALIGYDLHETPGRLPGIAAWLSPGDDDMADAAAEFQKRFAMSLRSADSDALLFTGAPAVKAKPLLGTVSVMHLYRWSGRPAAGIGSDGDDTPTTVVLDGLSDLPSMEALDDAMVSAFIPVEAALSMGPHPLPGRIAGTPVAFGYRSFGESRREYVLTLRQGPRVADTVVFLPGGAKAFTVRVSDGRTRWSQARPDLLVWTANPTIHTHALTARPLAGLNR